MTLAAPYATPVVAKYEVRFKRRVPSNHTKVHAQARALIEAALAEQRRLAWHR